MDFSVIKIKYSEIFRFSLVGIISNLISYVFFIFCVYILDINYVFTLTILFLLFFLINFFINRTWTFKSISNIKESAIKFIFTYIIGYLLNVSLLIYFVEYLFLPVGYVQICLIIFLAIYYYLMNKFFIHN